VGHDRFERPRDLHEHEDEAEAADTAPAEVRQSDREKVIEALGASPTDVDEVIRATALPARQVQIVLLELDLAGRLERHGQQRVSLYQP
jgi:DNA processing protein